ncbi:Hypothetical protein DHA2_16678 [Giardia duodenalis]|uniref:Uncharacterized protein n=1 Tax=Giardia intestinalis TaxID=5741 RepID=V6TJ51_GIAIN|nr:Hypothetical protein DHA2_16678 [Giardia intestinalis]
MAFQFGNNAASSSGATGTTTTTQAPFTFGTFGQQGAATASAPGGLNNTPTPAPAVSAFPTVGATAAAGFGTSGFTFGKPAAPAATTTPAATPATGASTFASANAPTFGGFKAANNATTTASGFNFGGALPSAFSKPSDNAAQAGAQLNTQNLQKQMENITPDDTLQKCPQDFQKLVLRIDSEQEKAKKALQTLESTIAKNKNEYLTICERMTALNHRLYELESCQTALETEATSLTSHLTAQRELAYKLSTNDPDARELAANYWDYKFSSLQEKHQRLQSQLLCLATALGVPVSSRIPCQTMDELYGLLESLYQQARIYQIKLGIE